MRESILNVLQQDEYRIGNCQVLLYDRRRTTFPEGYLSQLYQLCKLSGHRNKMGILPTLFCGMADLSHDAITCYLANRPVLVPVLWSSPTQFLAAGIAFPTTVPVMGLPTSQDKAIFAGYGMFKGVWGTPEAEILGMLGLAYFFLSYDVTAIHGLRYADNALTARFTHQFGFKDNGSIPRYMLRNGELVTGISSTLLIEDFEQYVERKLVELFNRGELAGTHGHKTTAKRPSSNRRKAIPA